MAAGMDADDCVHEDHPRHECGVFAAFNVDNAAKNIFFALYALQHRGQESAGIATSDRFSFNVHRGMGLVSQIFNEDVMKSLTGRIGVGHTRYSTKGSSVIGNAQPFVLETDKGRMAVAHNGQLVHEEMLRRRLLRAGTGLFTTTDSEIIAQMLARDTTDRLANIRLVYSGPTEMIAVDAAPEREAGSHIASGGDEAAVTAAAAVSEAAPPNDTQGGTLREPASSASGRVSATAAAMMRASPGARAEAKAAGPTKRGGCMGLPDSEDDGSDAPLLPPVSVGPPASDGSPSGRLPPVHDAAVTGADSDDTVPAGSLTRVVSIKSDAAPSATGAGAAAPGRRRSTPASRLASVSIAGDTPHARVSSRSAGEASPGRSSEMLVSASREDAMVQRIAALVAQAEGAFAFVVLAGDAVYGTRDRFGFRPLCIGKRTNAGAGGASYFLSSESCALGTVGASLVREVHPGEIVRVDARGVHSWVALPELQPRVQPALCVFEYVYFARPDSLIEGQLVHSVRQRLGRVLARECPVEADIVSGVPDSSIAAAIGYSAVSGLPYTEVFCKNRYIGRTFIQPDQTLRNNAIHLKFNALTHNVAGKRLVLIDDSIVRGNTLRKLVPLLREAGAKEVHIRISSPPLRHPCYMGVDIGTYDELIAHGAESIDQIRDHIGADSLEYITHEGMMDAVKEGIGGHHPHAPVAAEPTHTSSSTGGEVTSSHSKLQAASDQWSMPTGHCSACFTGKYPIRLEW